MDKKSRIFEQIQAFLEITKMSVRQLSLEAGINPASVSLILSGKRQDMLADNADALRHAMKCLNYDAAKQAGVE